MKPHITLEELSNLTEDEIDFLLYLVNITFPVLRKNQEKPDEYPITYKLLTTIHKGAIKFMLEACIIGNRLTEEGKPIHEKIKNKLLL